VAGTPPYLAPEQADGRVADVSFRADVYALGAMLYRLLAGRGPYAPREGTDEPAKTLELIRRGPPTPLRTVAPEAPAPLVAIGERAMAREPKGRYASVEALARDLRAFVETLTEDERP
jgi:serine/threonine-protein kinase